jgi:hypothetical protein
MSNPTKPRRSYYMTDDDIVLLNFTDTEWLTWFLSENRARVIDHTVISEWPRVWVTTVFYGLDSDIVEMSKFNFETLSFHSNLIEEAWRYQNREEALAGHARAVELARGRR